MEEIQSLDVVEFVGTDLIPLPQLISIVVSRSGSCGAYLHQFRVLVSRIDRLIVGARTRHYLTPVDCERRENQGAIGFESVDSVLPL